jgi:very-short-patch-repair endonuclease
VNTTWRPARLAAIVDTMADYPCGLDDFLAEHDHVLDAESALHYLSRAALRWRLASGRWQQPCRSVVVAHSGPMTQAQRLRTAVLWAGTGAVLAGLTAGVMDGLKGFTDRYSLTERPIHLLVPAKWSPKKERPDLPIVVHYSRVLGPEAIHPAKQPPRTRIARSLVDAAAWMATDRGAQAVLAAGVQQRLVRVEDLTKVITGNQRLHRRKLIADTLADITGGAQALSELDFTRLVVRAYKLPEPDRQRRRRNRYLDAVWEREKVIAEIDGAQHMDPLHYWEDMERDIDMQLDGYRVLRFPAWVVRYNPGHVAARIREALA